MEIIGLEHNHKIQWYQRIRLRVIGVLAIIIVLLLLLNASDINTGLTGNFLETNTERIHIPYGSRYTVNINVTNNHTSASNLTLTILEKGTNFIARLVNHPYANINDDRHVLNTSDYPLSPGEVRIFNVEILSYSFDGDDGNLSVKAILEDSPYRETLNISVNTQHPVDFPGMEFPAILLMVCLALALYWKRVIA